MATRVVDIRLTGKELFIYYYKQLGDHGIHCGGCTNKRILSKRTGIDEGILMRVFTRKGLWYYEDEDVIILKLRTSDIEKGKQSIARRGKGGMEHFVKYIMKDGVLY